MIARIAGTVVASLIVLVVVSLLVGLGVLWLTGGVARAALIGLVCGFLAASVVAMASTVSERSEERPGQGHDGERSGDGPDS